MQCTSRLILRLKHFLSPPFPSKLYPSFQVHTDILLPKNQMVYSYLIDNFKFPESKALRISNQFSSVRTLEKPQSVVKYLKAIGFTDTQIIASANASPQILFTTVDRTLKPKIDFLAQELGLSSCSLGMFISKNSPILTYSLTKRLKPIIDVVRNIMRKHNGYCAAGDDNLFRVLNRCNYVITSRDSHKKLLANVLYLESCSIVGTQLTNLLIRAPRLFSLSETELRRLVSRVLDLGLSYESRMFVHGLHTMSCISNETFFKKRKLVTSFGFTENECMVMFKKVPVLIRVSEEKLRTGLDFFLEILGMERSVLIRNAPCLMYSMEDRVFARYRVLKLLESKGILKKQPPFPSVLRLSEEAFLNKYISRFPAHVEDLLFQYKGHLLDSSSD